ncbi:hypothetical protein EIN_156840 [Entamoeba invadens IP1]|uniref:Uncharacterized protein n=1 Tax=Entamoeba invadens IP1 TaxID=370355 RepID=L7FLL0_ENTIV|nr:hypothetical protein EIN_156840 [Entamoeba invadens IP1]ELP84044.1 hypothetical protein EIN_156840 [Entamoeba invadens IP1]|eukprot:XP_004183390.1 hypothetical protein EIN_156840 [Entamoeba invadens IP1]
MLNSKENIDEFLKSISNETLGLYNQSEIENSSDSAFYVQHEVPEPLIIIELITEEYDYKKEINEYRNNGAAFFAYYYTEEYKCFSKYLKIAQIFDSLSVENKIRHELNNNCLIYALQQATINEKVVDLYCVHCYSRYQKIKLIDKVSKSCNIRIQIKNEELKRKDHANTIMIYIGSDNEEATEISMYLFRDSNMKGDHYFLDKNITITPFYLKNRVEMNKWALDHNKPIESLFNKQRKKGNSYLTNPGAKSNIKLSELILYIRDNNGFKPYSLSDVLHLPSDLSDYVNNQSNHWII